MKKIAIFSLILVIILTGCSQSSQTPNQTIAAELEKITKKDAKGFSFSETREMLDNTTESSEIQNQFINILADNHGDRAFRNRLHTINPDDNSNNVIQNIYKINNVFYHQNMDKLEPAEENETQELEKKLITFAENFAPLVKDVPFKKNEKDGRYSYENEDSFSYGGNEYTYFRIVYLEEYQTLDIYFSNIEDYQTVKININFHLDDDESVKKLLDLEQIAIPN